MLDALPAGGERSPPASSASRGASLLALNPRLSRCPTVPQEATTTFQLNSHSRENISRRVWLGSRSQRFSTDRFSCGGCIVCMNLQLVCMMVRDHCMHYGWRQRRQWQVGPEQTCENSGLLAAAKQVAEAFLREDQRLMDLDAFISNAIPFPRKTCFSRNLPVHCANHPCHVRPRSPRTPTMQQQ